ncbi:MAG: hypothetical protein K2Q34_05560 [Alphaproteobacteria bacterium]|nr:hypothetical protein [Alphaproteobacteria bacterium]
MKNTMYSQTNIKLLHKLKTTSVITRSHRRRGDPEAVLLKDCFSGWPRNFVARHDDN